MSGCVWLRYCNLCSTSAREALSGTQWLPRSTNQRFVQPAPKKPVSTSHLGRRSQHDSPPFVSLFPCQSPPCAHLCYYLPSCSSSAGFYHHIGISASSLSFVFKTTNVQTVQHKSNWSQTRDGAPNRWPPNQATKMTLIVEVRHGSVSAIQPNHQLPLTCADPVFLHLYWNSLFLRSSLPLLPIVRRPRCVPFQDALVYSVKTQEKKKEKSCGNSAIATTLPMIKAANL